MPEVKRLGDDIVSKVQPWLCRNSNSRHSNFFAGMLSAHQGQPFSFSSTARALSLSFCTPASQLRVMTSRIKTTISSGKERKRRLLKSHATSPCGSVRISPVRIVDREACNVLSLRRHDFNVNVVLDSTKDVVLILLILPHIPYNHSYSRKRPSRSV